jgi:intein/homing endonuclease
MGKRGPKPKGKVKIKWSSNFAYAIGLIVSDGCLSPNGRHITFTSKEKEQIYNFKKCLELKNIKTGNQFSEQGYSSSRIQFGDVLFYKFLVSIGLTPNKSLVIKEVKVPDEFYFDFLRGEFDGDGSSNSYWDKRWKSSFLIYLNFTSGSIQFLEWIQKNTKRLANVKGHLTTNKQTKKKKPFYQLKYAKKEAVVLFDKMYYNKRVVCLKRKKEKLQEAFKVNEKQQSKYK